MSETVSTAAAAPQPNTATTRTAEKPTVDQGEAAASTVLPSSQAGASAARGRGRGRGRGWYRRGRGRGKGRGGTPRPAQEQDGEGNDAKEGDPSGTPAPAAVPPERQEKAPDVDDTGAGPDAGPSGPSNDATAQRRPWKGWTERPPKVRLTHFIALPLGHSPAFREKVTPFTTALLASEPAIPGLDASIVVPPRRMHFTLGVMSLHRQSPTDPDAPIKTLEEATKVLQELKPKILTMLNGERLRVSLDQMDIMRPFHGDPEQANVMWVGPAESESTKRLKDVGNLIKKTFEDAGLLIKEDRPLKLHCTVVNSIYRNPRPRYRQPFSYPAILASDAVKSVLAPNEVVETQDVEKPKRGPVKVDLGEWDIDEVQICEMGSHGAEGEYVAAARCQLI